jgi:hypothetical protein
MGGQDFNAAFLAPGWNIMRRHVVCKQERFCNSALSHWQPIGVPSVALRRGDVFEEETPSSSGPIWSQWRWLGQPSSARRPASLIMMQTTSIFVRLGPVTISLRASARPASMRPAIMGRSNPTTSRSPVTPYGMVASSTSASRCSLLRLGSLGGVAIGAELTESSPDDCRAPDTKLKNRTERAISLSNAFRSPTR